MSEYEASQPEIWKIIKEYDTAEYPNGYFSLEFKKPDDLTEEEARKLENYARKVNVLAKACGRAADRMDPTAEAQNRVRTTCLSELLDLAEQLQEGDIDERTALEDFGRISGKYDALNASARSRKAAIMKFQDENGAEDSRVWALTLDVKEHELTAEQIALSIEIQKAYDVVDLVMDRRQMRGNQPGSKKQGLAVRKNYVRQLKEIADEGLMSSALTGYAARKLDLFKDSFVQREANRVKNQHVKALGRWAAQFTIIFLILVAALELASGNLFQHIKVLDKLDADKTLELLNHIEIVQRFLFLSAGASVGAWMSFTLRKVELGFDDLILLEPDRLNPAARIIFVVVLTCVIGGILQLGWISITFAGNSKPLMPGSGVGEALMLGILCGIAERSLSGAIVGRANSMSSVVLPAKNPDETLKRE